MRILHVTPYFQPGMGYQENYLPRAQQQLGHEVVLITSDRYPPHPDYKETMKWSESHRIVGPGQNHEDSIRVVRLKPSWEWKAHWWVYLPGIWVEIRAFNPDIIHVHCINGMLTYQVLAGNMNKRYNVVVDDHNNYFNKVPYTWKKWAFYHVMKYLGFPVLLRSVKRVLPMSHEVREYLYTELGVSRGITTLNHLGADPEQFKRDPELGKAVRKKYGIPDEAVVIVNAGKITKVKDNHVLLEAMGNLVERDKRAYLIMIGNAPAAYREQLAEIIERRGIAGHVRWIDFLPHEELPAHYSASEIGVWPGDWSCTVLEAASCGVALVQPNLLYTKYSSANDNSLNFERGSVTDLTDKLYQLVSDEELMKAMGQRSRELIERELNWNEIARQTVEIYRKTLEDRTFDDT